MYPPHQRWALALAAVISEEQTFDIASSADLQIVAKRLYEGENARDSAQLVALLKWAFSAGFIDEMTAWQVMLMTGVRMQKKYDSWESYARAYDPNFSITSEMSPWKDLPWDLDLGITILDPHASARFKKTICSTCGAPKSRPSATAYVYCDHCGALADYDFQKACEIPLAQPGPVYETLAAALGPKLESARIANDRETFRAVQMELFDAWASACPNAAPPRVRDLEYRKKYVAYLAEAAVVSAFDERSRELDEAMRKCMTGLRIEKLASGALRVDPTQFKALFESVIARESHAEEIHERAGVYAMHPDGASVELQKRMAMSMFAQGWLPMLDETTAGNMLTRLNLNSEYSAYDNASIANATCDSCGASIETMRDADFDRIVCDYCGHTIRQVSASS